MGRSYELRVTSFEPRTPEGCLADGLRVNRRSKVPSCGTMKRNWSARRPLRNFNRLSRNPALPVRITLSFFARATPSQFPFPCVPRRIGGNWNIRAHYPLPGVGINDISVLVSRARVRGVWSLARWHAPHSDDPHKARCRPHSGPHDAMAGNLPGNKCVRPSLFAKAISGLEKRNVRWRCRKSVIYLLSRSRHLLVCGVSVDYRREVHVLPRVRRRYAN